MIYAFKRRRRQRSALETETVNCDAAPHTVSAHAELAHQPEVPVKVVRPTRHHVVTHSVGERSEDYELVRSMAIDSGVRRKFIQEAFSHEATKRFRAPPRCAGPVRTKTATG